MSKTSEDEHYDEFDRLWLALAHDLLYEVEVFAGFHPTPDHARWERFKRNWDKLCALNIDTASALAHGISEVAAHTRGFGQPNSAGEHELRQMDEMLGVVTKGREANPGVEVKTLGELYALGEEAIRAEVEDEFGESGAT